MSNFSYLRAILIEWQRADVGRALPAVNKTMSGEARPTTE